MSYTEARTMEYSLDQPYLDALGLQSWPLAHESGPEKVRSLRYAANCGHCLLPVQSVVSMDYALL